MTDRTTRPSAVAATPKPALRTPAVSIRPATPTALSHVLNCVQYNGRTSRTQALFFGPWTERSSF